MEDKTYYSDHNHSSEDEYIGNSKMNNNNINEENSNESTSDKLKSETCISPNTKNHEDLEKIFTAEKLLPPTSSSETVGEEILDQRFVNENESKFLSATQEFVRLLIMKAIIEDAAKSNDTYKTNGNKFEDTHYAIM